MNKLTILVRPKHKGISKSDTVADLLDYWQRFHETEKSTLEVLSLKFCSSYTLKKHKHYKETHCKKDKSKYTSYKIHKRCERYKTLPKMIQQSYRNLYLEEEKKILNEAKVM